MHQLKPPKNPSHFPQVFLLLLLMSTEKVYTVYKHLEKFYFTQKNYQYILYFNKL